MQLRYIEQVVCQVEQAIDLSAIPPTAEKTKTHNHNHNSHKKKLKKNPTNLKHLNYNYRIESIFTIRSRQQKPRNTGIGKRSNTNNTTRTTFDRSPSSRIRRSKTQLFQNLIFRNLFGSSKNINFRHIRKSQFMNLNLSPKG